MTVRQIQLGDITFANDRPFALLGGVNVLEDLDFALRCAGHYKHCLLYTSPSPRD